MSTRELGASRPHGKVDDSCGEWLSRFVPDDSCGEWVSRFVPDESCSERISRFFAPTKSGHTVHMSVLNLTQHGLRVGHQDCSSDNSICQPRESRWRAVTSSLVLHVKVRHFPRAEWTLLRTPFGLGSNDPHVYVMAMSMGHS